jgi:hypothetical protein
MGPQPGWVFRELIGTNHIERDRRTLIGRALHFWPTAKSQNKQVVKAY